MKNHIYLSRHPNSLLRPGFALVVTLSLMILLTILAVGLLSLSSIALRSSNQSAAQSIARANARLAMMLALGELQKYAGLDQRVTANASLLETAGTTVANRQWMGVWRTDSLRDEPASPTTPILGRLTTTTGIDAGSLKDRREDGTTYNRTNEVLSWLVSTPDPSARLNPLVAATDPVRLVGAGSATALDADQVWAPRVALKQGGYAWWVADEGCKARFNLAAAPDGSAAASPAWINPAQEGISSMTGLEQYESLADADLTKTISRRTGDLTYPNLTPSAPPLKAHFHDLGFHSAGVLADTQNSGLRRDLSAFLATGTIAASGTKPAIDVNTPLLNSPMLELVSAKFGMLKSWNDLATKVDASNTLEVVPPIAVAPPTIPTTSVLKIGPGTELDLTRQTVATVHPVIIDAGISYGVSLVKTTTPGATAGTFQYKVRLHYYPRLVLWNPYQVGIKASTYAAQFAMPHKFSIKVFDPSISGGSTLLNFFEAVGNSYAQSPGNNIPHRPAFMVPATTFEPGEALLFTADAGGASDRCSPWGVVGGAATSLANFPLSCKKPLPLQDSFMLESAYTVDLPDTNKSTYQVFAQQEAAHTKQYWYKLWQVKGPTGAGSIAGLLGNDLVNYPPLQYIAQTEDGVYGSDAPWFNGIPASTSERLLETAVARNAFYRFKWGHRIQWLADTNENQTIKPVSYNTPYLGYNVLANHNLRASWQVRSPVEVCLRASQAAARYTWGMLIDDPYGWDWSNSQLAPVPVNGKNRVSPFGAPALFGGQTYPLLSIPRKEVPILSLGALQHVPLSPFAWHPTYAIGNSLADPRGQRQRTTNYVTDAQWNTLGCHARSWLEYRQADVNPAMNSQAFLYDLSYEANFALWDSYFLSTVPRDFSSGKTLPNARIKPLASTTSALADMLDGNRAASQLMLDGAFNVNSTSEDAWAALLASFREDPALEITLADGSKVAANDVFSRLIQPSGSEYNNNSPYDTQTWNSYRKLDDIQIRALAKEIVVEVKQRGPFLSLADFINRRLVIPPTLSGAETPITLTGLKGSLQAAIDRTTINSTLANSFKIAKTEYSMGGPAPGDMQVQYGTNYPTPYFPATNGNIGYGPKPDHNHWADSKLVGAPAYLTQADILQKLGPVLTARSDTFTIRCYGECRDAAGIVTARAWAEAVVQRTPQPLNPSTNATDASGLNPLTTGTGQFGRRLDILSFRWLHSNEI